jgi:hypothetical protein
MSNLRARLARLENAPDPGPADPMPRDFWDWLACGNRRAHPAAAECSAYLRAQLPPGFIPHAQRTVNPVEQRLTTFLQERLARERPRCGLVELPNGGDR